MKLIACGLAGNSELFIDMSMTSIHPYVDQIIIVYDMGSKDMTKMKLEIWKQKLGDKLIILEREYEHSYDIKNGNQRARTFYLDYLKEHYMNNFCIVWDMDEIFDDNVRNLKEFLSALDQTKDYLISPKMEHFIGNLGHVDAAYMPGKNEHFVPNRLFNITKDKYYLGEEHPVLNSTSENKITGNLFLFTIWHLAYCREMYHIKERYLNHLNKSEIHSEAQLLEWFYMHISGKYPVKKIELTSLPSIIKKEFLIEDDFFYFKDRDKLELKHFLFIRDWFPFFRFGMDEENEHKKNVLDVGCGMGHFLFCWSTFGIEADGFDKSPFAINNSPHKFLRGNMWVADATKDFKTDKKYHLITCIDLLEHMNNEEEVDKVLNNIVKAGDKFFLFSIPFDKSEDRPADPNLFTDKTHKIFWSREKWIEKINSHGIKLFKHPDSMFCSHQLLIGIHSKDESIKVR